MNQTGSVSAILKDRGGSGGGIRGKQVGKKRVDQIMPRTRDSAPNIAQIVAVNSDFLKGSDGPDVTMLTAS